MTTDRGNDERGIADATMGRRTFVAGAGAAVGVGAGGARASARGTGDAGSRGAHPDEDSGESRGEDRSSPSIVAHRGFAGRHPENTVAAVEAASRGGRSERATVRGADMIEIDVMPTGDGDVVVFHDARLSSRDGGERGLTDADGVVWETPTDVVTGAEVLDSGETVPLLGEVMAAIPDGVAVNVEFKNPGTFDLRFAENLSGDALDAQRERWRPFTEDVLAVLDEHGNDVLVSSFYEAALATVRELSTLPVAPLLWDSIDAGLAIAREHDAEAVHPPYNMIRGTPFYADPYYTEGSDWSDTDLLAVAHEEGRDVNVYTVATWYQAEQLAGAGVDGLIADYPGLLRFGGR
ncbi:glycerophosphodiester phosphodiesterase [Halobaculum gomorrense]|nr:glycerophosphodiester phosphodiesterase [Halobaculum gomorrense]